MGKQLLNFNQLTFHFLSLGFKTCKPSSLRHRQTLYIRCDSSPCYPRKRRVLWWDTDFRPYCKRGTCAAASVLTNMSAYYISDWEYFEGDNIGFRTRKLLHFFFFYNYENSRCFHLVYYIYIKKSRFRIENFLK